MIVGRTSGMKDFATLSVAFMPIRSYVSACVEWKDLNIVEWWNGGMIVDS